jgi:hypothetical protein
MVRIQTTGLLADIRDRVYSRGEYTVSWSELEKFAAPMKVVNLRDVLNTWAESNMMSAEFHDTGTPQGQIRSVTFFASK